MYMDGNALWLGRKEDLSVVLPLDLCSASQMPHACLYLDPKPFWSPASLTTSAYLLMGLWMLEKSYLSHPIPRTYCSNTIWNSEAPYKVGLLPKL